MTQRPRIDAGKAAAVQGLRLYAGQLVLGPERRGLGAARRTLGAVEVIGHVGPVRRGGGGQGGWIAAAGRRVAASVHRERDLGRRGGAVLRSVALTETDLPQV